MKKFVLSLGLIALFSCSKDKTTEKNRGGCSNSNH